MTHEEAAEFLGAYALDAVDPDEAEAVELHLAECPRCRDELAHHREVAAALAFVGASAPEGLWSRVSAALETAPPEPELARLYPLRPVATAVSRRVIASVAALAAVAAAIIFVLGLQLNEQRRELNAVKRAVPSATLDQAALAASLEAGSTRVRLQSGDRQTYVDAVVTASGDGYLIANNLRALAGDRTYQLWGVEGATKISLGVLGSHPSVVPFRMSRTFHALAVTDEQAPGVVASQHEPVVVGLI